MKELLEMQPVATNFIALEHAEGGIQYGEKHELEIVDEVTERVRNGDFHVATAGRVPCKCIDGRTCRFATEGPNAAGGTETLFVADDLTSKSFAGVDGSVAEGMRNVINKLQSKNYPVGGHSDNHHEDQLDSGCGANDKLVKIYEMIVRNPGAVKYYVEAILGNGAVDKETEDLIIGNAGERTAFSRGKEVLDVLEGAEDSRVEELDGKHNEVVAAINMRFGTTLDRQALAEAYGPDYQSFNIDAWSFAEAAGALTDDANEARQKVIAMTYYNVATALVLCGPKMRVVVVE